MIRQRHKKNVIGTAPNSSTILDQVDTSTTVHDQDATNPPSGYPQQHLVNPPTPMYYYHYIFHFFSIIIILFGIIWTFQKLYTHVECDMTWSQRQFIEIDMFNQSSQSSKHHQYKFYKFIDQRDPRYKHLHMKSLLLANDSSTTTSSSTTSWCSSSSSNIVLYVPGHGGSYQQSRSIGAHGVQLTHRNIDHRTQQAILHRLSLQGRQRDTDHDNNVYRNTTTTTSTNIDDFFFDVYAFDFNEEGGAFHGSLLERQATYMVNVILTLTELCRRVDSKKNEAFPIHIVAHSIGGISTRLALQQLQLLNGHNSSINKNVRIQSVITLGTPHYMPVWSWDTTMHNLYHKLYTNQQRSSNMIRNGDDSLTPTTGNSTTIISISGGLRDEMIPPKACYMYNDNDAHTNEHFSLLTTDVIIPAQIEGKEYVPPYIGVDHRAIVWCHNILSQVRYILFLLIHSSDGIINDSLDETSNHINSRNIQSQEKLLRELFESSSSSKRNESHDYLHLLSDLQQSLKKKYGWYTAFVMETSLLYNTEILVNLFAFLGTVRYLRLDFGLVGNKLVLPTMSITFHPILCTILYYVISIGVQRRHTIPILSMFILAFLADSIFITTKFVLHKYLQGTLSCYEKPSTSFFVIKTVSILTILFWIILYAILGRKSWFRMEFVIVVTATALVSFLSIFLITTIPKGESVQQPQALYHERQLNYVVMLLWMLPPIVIGEIYAIFKGIYTWGIYAILLPVVVRLALNNNSVYCVTSFFLHPLLIPTTKQKVAMQLCRFIILSFCCWNLLTLDIHDHKILHPLPMLLLVATLCAIPDSLMM